MSADLKVPLFRQLQGRGCTPQMSFRIITLASTASQKAHCFFRHPPGTLQKARMRTRQHSLTESPMLLPAPRLAERRHAVQLVSAQFPPAQPHNKSIAFSGTRQDSLTESPHENLPTRPHRKPNPDRDRLTESQHAVPLVSAHNSRHCFFRHLPGQPYRKSA